MFKIDQFKEKPDLATAKKYVADPKYAWNAGMFLFSAQLMQQELAKHEPSIYPACEQAIAHGKVEKITASAFRRLSGDHFAQAKAISLDFAVMEHTRLAAVIPLDASWTDVGSCLAPTPTPTPTLTLTLTLARWAAGPRSSRRAWTSRATARPTGCTASSRRARCARSTSRTAT